MKFVLTSKILDRKVTFSRPGRSYIYADLNGKPGTLGNQICEGGAVMSGSAMTYSGDDDAEFARICRKWYRAYIRNH